MHKTFYQRLFDCWMLYLLQLVSTHQVSFSSRAVILDTKLNIINYSIIPKRNLTQVACSILISFLSSGLPNSKFQFSVISASLFSSIPIVSIISSFLFSKRIQKDTKSPGQGQFLNVVKDQSKLLENPSFFYLEFRCPSGVSS